MMHRLAIVSLALIFWAMGMIGAQDQALAENRDKPWVSKVISIQGRVTAKRLGQPGWQPVKLNDTLFAGDRIRVEANSRAGIRLSNDAVLRLDQNTTLVFTEIEKETTFILKLLKGAANFFSRRPRSLKFLTPFVNGVVEGTEFYVQVDPEQTSIDLFEGRILAQNPYGTLQLAKGQGAMATADSAPQRRILVKPRDSVQWALYYPPVLALGPDDVSNELHESLMLSNQGRISEAIDTLEQIPMGERDARFFTFQAALLLHVGRVDQAREAIDLALSSDPQGSQVGDALALRVLIAVVQNQKDDALAVALNAVQKSPNSVAARLSLSYAQQAGFNLPESLVAAQAAVTRAPENGTAWARLAELRLSIGELDQGVQAARKAVTINPHAAHAHTTLGFAYLTQIKTEKARAAFEQAIVLDSAAPLPRLGLGLAKIRDGDLKQGRAEIEIAVGLDPVNALLRSYLGKAYFDEKRDPLDMKQLEIAKTLDPSDPTPWYYDAIRKQTLNRPVEALQDLQKSIDLNNNRAIYRSRLLLDQDLAAKSANLARIYEDLGFERLALVNGYQSLNSNPTSHSAHRFLSDAYTTLPRHEIARVSMLLQSQLLQPISITPVQPYLAESEPFILNGAGPSTPSLNEYTPLFNRDRLVLHAGGLAGGNATVGDEVVLSGVWGRYSYSLGQFHYETDGFRKNNDQVQDIYNAFMQMSLSPTASVQAEYRYREAEKGDLELRFDPENFSSNLRHEEEVETLRFGLRNEFTVQSSLLTSVIYQNVDSIDAFSGFESVLDGDGLLIEVRHIYTGEPVEFSVGGGHYRSDFRIKDTYDQAPPGITNPSMTKMDIKHSTAYIYASLNAPVDVTWILGGSGEWLDGSLDDRDQFNPKLGMMWDLSSQTTLRAAIFRTLQKRLVSDQTIEPVQVAGFNQFYEDGSGTDAWNYGVGVDRKFSDVVYAGIDLSLRELELPYPDPFLDQVRYADWDEVILRAYLNWILSSNLTFSVELQYEQFEKDPEFVGSNFFTRLETYKLPLKVNYFNSSGLSFQAKATYVDQSGKFGDPFFGDLISDSDQFWVVDASVRYQLPKIAGFITLEAKNVLDASFQFQDTDPANPQIYPEPYVFARLEFSF